MTRSTPASGGGVGERAGADQPLEQGVFPGGVTRGAQRLDAKQIARLSDLRAAGLADLQVLLDVGVALALGGQRDVLLIEVQQLVYVMKCM